MPHPRHTWYEYSCDRTGQLIFWCQQPRKTVTAAPAIPVIISPRGHIQCPFLPLSLLSLTYHHLIRPVSAYDEEGGQANIFGQQQKHASPDWHGEITKAHACASNYFGATKHCRSPTNPCNVTVSRAQLRENPRSRLVRSIEPESARRKRLCRVQSEVE